MTDYKEIKQKLIARTHNIALAIAGLTEQSSTIVLLSTLVRAEGMLINFYTYHHQLYLYSALVPADEYKSPAIANASTLCAILKYSRCISLPTWLLGQYSCWDVDL